MFALHKFGHKRVDPIIVNVGVNGHLVEMEVDTGASLSVIGEKTYNEIRSQSTLKPTKVQFKTYSGEIIKPIGELEVEIVYEGQQLQAPIFVLPGECSNLMGRNWLSKIKLNWHELFSMTDHPSLNEILTEYNDVFRKELGMMKGVEAKIHLQPDAQAVFCKARPVPYALTQRIDTELDRLVNEGVYVPVEVSDWAAPIVPIVKTDGSVRICGDYKITINKASKLDNYPIPKSEDIYACLAGGQKFTKLDFSQAYQQMVVEEESREYLTVNTHRGLFQPTRLAYGVKSAPRIFQRQMEKKLNHIPFTKVRIDDVIVSGRNDNDHLENLTKVLKTIRKFELRLKKEKCLFLMDELTFLGLRINAAGISPDPEKLTAIHKAPEPLNVSQLKSFLGMVNYYHRHLPNLSTLLDPLHQLLQKEVKWKWGTTQKQAFESVKSLLTSNKLLIHYDPTKPLVLSCDASPYGVGVVLSHRIDNGEERPIAFSSRSLTKAERNYSHLEKEALAIIFGVKKFHQYCYGRHFTIYSDHKPLLGILKEDKQIPAMTAARLQRWALILASHNYTLHYKPGNQAFSRLRGHHPGPRWDPRKLICEGNLIFSFLSQNILFYTKGVLLIQ